MDIFIAFMGYLSMHTILDMMPVLSTRLYVEFDWTPELESSLGAATFAGQTVSYLLTGLVANRVGRKMGSIFGMAWTVFWSILWSLSWDIESLIAIRLLASLGLGKPCFPNARAAKRSRAKPFIGNMVAVFLPSKFFFHKFAHFKSRTSKFLVKVSLSSGPDPSSRVLQH